MTILLNNNGFENESWKRELARQLPEFPVCVFGDPLDPAEIEYALVWNHPKRDLLNYPNLKAVLSLGAGAEHFIADDALPDVPLVLLSDPSVANDMAAHAAYWVLKFHRKYADYETQQCNRSWHRHLISPTSEYRVGVLGLGRIGSVVATRIRDFGYSVSGWSNCRQSIDLVHEFEGDSELDSFLGWNDVVINCLPLTPETHGLMDMSKFQLMRKGAYFINLSRGDVIVEDDLLSCLDSEQLSAAALDAVSQEPLPQSHPFWDHPKVYITPHMSGATFASSALKVIAENIHRIENGKQPFPLFDPVMGY